MECSFVVVGQSCTRPGVLAEVKRVLMSFCLVLVLEFVGAVLTGVLLLGLVDPMAWN